MDSESSAEGLVRFFVTVNCGNLCETGEVFGCLFVCGLEVLAVSAPRSIELDDLEGSERARRSAEATYGGVVGLGNEAIIVLAINLNDWRALCVETGVNWQSCQERSCCDGDNSGVNHFGGLWDFRLLWKL